MALTHLESSILARLNLLILVFSFVFRKTIYRWLRITRFQGTDFTIQLEAVNKSTFPSKEKKFSAFNLKSTNTKTSESSDSSISHSTKQSGSSTIGGVSSILAFSFLISFSFTFQSSRFNLNYSFQCCWSRMVAHIIQCYQLQNRTG